MKIVIRNRKEFITNFYKKLSIHQRINFKKEAMDYYNLFIIRHPNEAVFKIMIRKVIYKYYIK